MEQDKWISKKDALIMLEIIQRSLFCEAEEEFLSIMGEFKKLVYFECSTYGWVEINSILYGQKVKCRIMSDSYPEEYLKIYFDCGYHKQDHVIQTYFKTFELQNFSEIDKQYRDDSGNPIVNLSQDFGIGQGYAYGICDRNHYLATAFFLAGRHVENHQRSRFIIKSLIPHLSLIIKRLLSFPINEKIIQLTSIEREILQWLKEGKTTWETSSILSKSERAIKFHIDNVLKKLNAMNRTHAVAIALENHLLKL